MAESQEWFELAEHRRRKLENAAWIPLRASRTLIREKRFGQLGYRHEFFGVASVAVPVNDRDAMANVGWSRLGLAGRHEPYVDSSGNYTPADVERPEDGVYGIRLIIAQRGNSDEHVQWHVHPDLVIALGLRREGDVWLAIHEGYEEVIRLAVDSDGSPGLIEIRAEYLKDYLCARGLGLFINAFRERQEIVASADHLRWREDEWVTEQQGMSKWRGGYYAIHEGGTPFGAQTAVFHAARTDVDHGDDVPVMGPELDGNVRSRNWTVNDRGQRLFLVRGEFWQSVWVEPGQRSPRVREDESPSTVTFAVDASGERMDAESLKDDDDTTGRWLWFTPDVIPVLAHRRGGRLSWYTGETGGVRCSPDYNVHFGINPKGLINVYADDIARLPEWQQRIWAGFNVTPDGGVSAELLASQVDAEPAETHAPEAYLRDGLRDFDNAFVEVYGAPIIRPHEQHEELLAKAHRFRSLDRPGLFSLAKDLARLSADSFDTSLLHSIVQPKKGEKWGSLKSLEKVLALYVRDEVAARLAAPLFAIYDMRLGDAHLTRSDIDDAYSRAGVDVDEPFVMQGRQLVDVFVRTLYFAAETIRGRAPVSVRRSHKQSDAPDSDNQLSRDVRP